MLDITVEEIAFLKEKIQSLNTKYEAEKNKKN